MTTTRKKAQQEDSAPMLGLAQNATQNLCSGEVCSVRVRTPAGYTSPLQGVDMRGLQLEQASLTDIVSPEYYQAMMQAAKFGFLYTFLTATPNDLLNRHFVRQKFDRHQIYYAKQCINALTMLALSSYLGMTDVRSLFLSIGTPAASASLHYSGFSESVSTILPAGLLIATQFATDIAHSGQTLLTLLSGLGGGLLGKKAASSCYRMMNDLFVYATGRASAVTAFVSDPAIARQSQ